ncbi:MAG: hypothetical protein ACXVPD_08235, partial [Bacteroidia bacterium]
MGLRSQTADSLRLFINKNSVALKSIQKNAMNTPGIVSAAEFKALLKLHLASVNEFASGREVSMAAAYKVRTQSLSYISALAPNAAAYFKITAWETQNFSGTAEPKAPERYLSQSELKSVDRIDFK